MSSPALTCFGDSCGGLRGRLSEPGFEGWEGFKEWGIPIFRRGHPLSPLRYAKGGDSSLRFGMTEGRSE